MSTDKQFENVHIDLPMDRDQLASWSHILQISNGSKVILNQFGQNQVRNYFGMNRAPMMHWFDPAIIFDVQSQYIPHIEPDQRLKNSIYKENDLRFGYVNLTAISNGMKIFLKINIAFVEPTERHCVETCSYTIGWKDAAEGCYVYFGEDYRHQRPYVTDIMAATTFPTAQTAESLAKEIFKSKLNDQTFDILELVTKTNVVCKVGKKD